MKITIVGCGNAGLIHAAKLIEFGHRVALLKTSVTNSCFFDKIVSEKGYNVLDSTNCENRFFVTPEIITRDVEKAISFADIIMRSVSLCAPDKPKLNGEKSFCAEIVMEILNSSHIRIILFIFIVLKKALRLQGFVFVIL